MTAYSLLDRAKEPADSRLGMRRSASGFKQAVINIDDTEAKKKKRKRDGFHRVLGVLFVISWFVSGVELGLLELVFR